MQIRKERRKRKVYNQEKGLLAAVKDVLERRKRKRVTWMKANEGVKTKEESL